MKKTEASLKFAQYANGELLKLPLSMLMQTIFLGGNKGAGKTSAMKRLFEAAHAGGAQCGVIAPLGRWWSLRIAKNGKGRGLRDVFVFGGKHGDVEVTATSGRAVARTVVTKRIHFVLDVELMRKTDRAQFIGDFLEELWQLKKEEDASHPMVLFIDEAQVVAPQKSTSKEVERMREFAADLCREGRNHGIGMVLGAQRSANVDKDLLALVEMLIVMRTIHHLDRKVYQLWVDEKGDKDDDEGAWLKRLRRLEKGQAYLYAPELNVFERVDILLPDTYDATKTATLGARVAKVGKLSKLDVRKLGEELTKVVEAAEANDPAKLQQQIYDLNRQLAAQTAAVEKRKPAKAPKVDKRALKRLEKAAKAGHAIATKIADAVAQLNKLQIPLGAPAGEFRAAANMLTAFSHPVPLVVKTGALDTVLRNAEKSRLFGERYGTDPAAMHAQLKKQPVVKDGEAEPLAVVGKMKTILAVLAHGPLSRAEMPCAIGMNPGSTFRAYVARLKQAGYVREEGSMLTLGEPTPESVPTEFLTYGALVERNRDVLIGKMKNILNACEANLSHGLPREAMPATVGMEAGSTFRAYVARMKQRGVIVEQSGRLMLSHIMQRGLSL